MGRRSADLDRFRPRSRDRLRRPLLGGESARFRFLGGELVSDADSLLILRFLGKVSPFVAGGTGAGANRPVIAIVAGGGGGAADTMGGGGRGGPKSTAWPATPSSFF